MKYASSISQSKGLGFESSSAKPYATVLMPLVKTLTKPFLTKKVKVPSEP